MQAEIPAGEDVTEPPAPPDTTTVSVYTAVYWAVIERSASIGTVHVRLVAVQVLAAAPVVSPLQPSKRYPAGSVRVSVMVGASSALYDPVQVPPDAVQPSIFAGESSDVTEPPPVTDTARVTAPSAA